MPRLVLASSSPRRIELLKLLVPDFLTATSDVEAIGSDLYPDFPLQPDEAAPDAEPDVRAWQEAILNLPPESSPTLWAWRKAMDVAGRSADMGEDVVILGADTVVVNDGTPLGKPIDHKHAFEMLTSLRGHMHYVFSGYAIVIPKRNGKLWTLDTGLGVSIVWMRDYSDEELRGYVATDEPLDKAGAYAVQGLGGALVERVEGCYRNVIGLPLCAVRQALVEAAVEALAYPESGYCPNCRYIVGRT